MTNLLTLQSCNSIDMTTDPDEWSGSLASINFADDYLVTANYGYSYNFQRSHIRSFQNFVKSGQSGITVVYRPLFDGIAGSLYRFGDTISNKNKDNSIKIKSNGKLKTQGKLKEKRKDGERDKRKK